MLIRRLGESDRGVERNEHENEEASKRKDCELNANFESFSKFKANRHLDDAGEEDDEK